MLCSLVVGALGAAALVSCRGTDPVGPADLAGTYALVTVSGQPVPTAGPSAVLSGVIVLGAYGGGTRRVQYATAAAPGIVEDASAGTFAVRGDSVVLNVTVLAARPPAVARLAAARQGATLTLRFGSPVDGPDVVEVYRRE